MNVVINTDWSKVFNDQEIKDNLICILNQLDTLYQTKTIYPDKQNIFACFNFFNIKDTKVVIIGQDPYYKPNQANGLAFSVNDNVKLPKSLINIFKELQSDLNIKRTNGNLTDWAKQGVLLLNESLTVEANKSMSHKYLNWSKITDFVIKYLNLHVKHVVYILWSNQAISKKQLINLDNNLVLTSSHPSPLSAHVSFFGSKPFSKANNYLIKNNCEPIKW